MGIAVHPTTTVEIHIDLQSGLIARQPLGFRSRNMACLETLHHLVQMLLSFADPFMDDLFHTETNGPHLQLPSYLVQRSLVVA